MITAGPRDQDRWTSATRWLSDRNWKSGVFDVRPPGLITAGPRDQDRWASTARWLSNRNRKSIVFNMRLFQPVYRNRVLLVPHLDCEELVIAVDDSIGTCEGCLERGLPGIGADEHELGVEQPVWDIGLGRAMGDGRDRLEVPDLLS